MPTTFQKGISEPHQGGRIRKTTTGKWCGEVSDSGKVRRAFFDTKEEAKQHLSNMKARRNVQGNLALALTADQTRLAMDALHRMEKAGCKPDLIEAVEFYLKHNRPGLLDMTFTEALNAYIAELKAPTDNGDPARPETIKSKEKRLRTFTDKHGKQSVRQITEADVKNWVDSFGDIAPRTLLNRRAELQSVFNYCEKVLPGFENKVCKVKQRRRKESQAPAAILAPTDAKKVLEYLEKNYPGRYAVTMALMMFAGIRPGELTRPDNPLTWASIRLEEGKIHIPAETAKTREPRSIPIEANLREWLKRYPDEGRIAPSDSRFREARGEAVREGAKMKGGWPSDGARHTYGTAAGELHGLHKAAGWMGHSGGLAMFKAHYEGRMTRKDAEVFFNILPYAEKAGKVIQMEASA